MHVRSCKDKTIRIPFFVGDDKSRTWVFTMSKSNLITLKHDHRHKDGSEDKITQYGALIQTQFSRYSIFSCRSRNFRLNFLRL